MPLRFLLSVAPSMCRPHGRVRHVESSFVSSLSLVGDVELQKMPAVAFLEVVRFCTARGRPRPRRFRVASISGVQSRRAVRREGCGESRVDRVSRVREAKRGPFCMMFIAKRKEFYRM